MGAWAARYGCEALKEERQERVVEEQQAKAKSWQLLAVTEARTRQEVDKGRRIEEKMLAPTGAERKDNLASPKALWPRGRSAVFEAWEHRAALDTGTTWTAVPHRRAFPG